MNNMQTYLKNPNLIYEACYIGEKWQVAQSGKTIKVYNPFDGELLGIVPDLSANEVKAAIAHADDAQDVWVNKTAHERGEILHAWADLIDEHKEDLATIMTLEQGKPLAEARGEIDYANSFIRWFAEEGKRIYGDTILATKPNLRHVVLKQPIGVCAAITPWNFPSAMLTRKVAPALAAGCTMIVKPAGQTPFSAIALVVLAQKAGLPKGVLQLVTGNSSVVGEVLTQDERIKKLSFTGSTEVGRQLMAQAANTVKKLSFELGGDAPFIIFEDADIEQAVTGLMNSKFRNAGQTCVCANRIYVHHSIKDKFLALFKVKVEALQVGNGMDEGVEIGPLINEDTLEKVETLLADAVAKGATIITGGTRHHAGKLCYTPTIVADIDHKMDIANEEIFGPIAPVMTFDSEDEVIAAANDTIYGLAAYFYTNDMQRSWRVAERLQYGIVGQNTGLISTAVAPFGGVKQSGFGREGSKYGIDEYLLLKYWCVNVG